MPEDYVREAICEDHKRKPAQQPQSLLLSGLARDEVESTRTDWSVIRDDAQA